MNARRVGVPLLRIGSHATRHVFLGATIRRSDRCTRQIIWTSARPQAQLSERIPSDDVLSILKSRGLVDNCTNEAGFIEALKMPLKVYCGFDPTADSLHLGNLLGIVVLSWFHRTGHEPVVLLGGATGRVGDPSGKSRERPLLDEELLRQNVAAIRESISVILSRGQGHRGVSIVDNYDWFKDITLLDFLRDAGKFARLGNMLSKDSVRSRLDSEEGLSFTEFSYQLLQGYDFMHLFASSQVVVQVGGSDQWGNITAGTELIRRVCRQDGAFGLTFPLLLKSDGTKFGKSASGAIWLSKERLSPYKFFQHLLLTSDNDVIKLLKMLTFMSLEDIDVLESSMSRVDYVPNTAQKVLACEVTRFVHGEDGLAEALKVTESLKPGSNAILDVDSLRLASDVVPSVSLARDRVLGQTIVDVLALSGLLESKGAAKRMLLNGGIRLNNMKITEESQQVTESDILGENMFLLAAGKKNKLVVYLS